MWVSLLVSLPWQCASMNFGDKAYEEALKGGVYLYGCFCSNISNLSPGIDTRVQATVAGNSGKLDPIPTDFR